MSFDNLKTSDEIAADTDFLGGGGALESGVYTFGIDMAYLDKSSGGAMSLNLQLKNAQGQSLKQTIYITSGDAKGNRNWYPVKKNGQETGEKRYLPGFNVGNAICLLSIGKEISELSTEEKMVNVYDFDQKKEVPTKKNVLMDLLGAEVDLGIMKQIVDKKTKVGDTYVANGETRVENEIAKVFRARDGMTVAEITAQVETSTFRKDWADKNTGQTRDKSTKDAGVSSGLPAGPGAAPTAGGAVATASSSLFD